MKTQKTGTCIFALCASVLMEGKRCSPTLPRTQQTCIFDLCVYLLDSLLLEQKIKRSKCGT